MLLITIHLVTYDLMNSVIQEQIIHYIEKSEIF